ncbi:hypothetical protein V5O48_009361 [Marasmius crinis-equi]|uniref:Uncharacterized protein n=1 Tax=Marasmius crinis-equi TaxID=585013 RepID=A0ABR3FBV7_9AGAR
MSHHSTPPRSLLVKIIGSLPFRLLFRLILAVDNFTRPRTEPRIKHSPYAVCNRVLFPHPTSYHVSTFCRLVQKADLECKVCAIVLCKRTDGFQHDTLVPIISVPGEPAKAIMFLERVGGVRSWDKPIYRQNDLGSISLLKLASQKFNPDMSVIEIFCQDIFTVFPEPSLFWRYDENPGSQYPPFHQLPHLIQDLSVSYPSLDAFVQEEQLESASVENQVEEGGARRSFESSNLEHGSRQIHLSQVPNAKADHAFIHAVVFPEGHPNPPTVLDLAVAALVVSDYRPKGHGLPRDCDMFAPAVCKLMQQRFEGVKVENGELDGPGRSRLQPTSDSPPIYKHVKADGLTALQVVCDDSPGFTDMVTEMVALFENARVAHPATDTMAMMAEAIERLDAEIKMLRARQQPSPPGPASVAETSGGIKPDKVYDRGGAEGDEGVDGRGAEGVQGVDRGGLSMEDELSQRKGWLEDELKYSKETMESELTAIKYTMELELSRIKDAMEAELMQTKESMQAELSQTQERMEMEMRFTKESMEAEVREMRQAVERLEEEVSTLRGREWQ